MRFPATAAAGRRVRHAVARADKILAVGRPLNLLVPHFPAALLLLFSGGAGTFIAGADAHWAIAGHLALLIFVGALGTIWLDPLRLGRIGNLLLVALALSVLASHLTSPVTRAGRLGVLLLPAFLMVPSAVARCWSSEPARRQGLLSVSLVTLLVAGWSLLGWWRFGTPGTSLPLGHHGLLAAWLLAVLPLALLPWRDGGVGRAIAGLAGVTGLVSVFGTGSLAAALTVGGVAALVVVGRRKAWWMLGVGALLLAAQLPRLAAILDGSDSSTAGRWSYLQAAGRGWLERPILGWGPGAARWTLPEHLRPIPGADAADQVVADPHSLPLLISYELGAVGLLLVAALAWVWLKQRPGRAEDPALRRAALLGLAMLALISCVGRPLSAPAIPLAALIGLGAVLAAEGVSAREGKRGVAVGVAVGVAALVMPLDLAHLAYDRAARAHEPSLRVAHLRRALELDPEFPLYRARLAWLEAEEQGPEAARQAWIAAESARGLAQLWSVAGILAQETGEPWSREALLRSCRLNPLGVIAPYRLTFEAGPHAIPIQWMARALLAEPLVSTATVWRERGLELGAAVEELGRLDGIDAGWHAWLESAVSAQAGGTDDRRRILALEMDGEAATSLSLYAFRRRAWPIDLARIEIDDAASSVELGAIAPLSEAAAEILRDPSCGLGRP